MLKFVLFLFVGVLFFSSCIEKKKSNKSKSIQVQEPCFLPHFQAPSEDYIMDLKKKVNRFYYNKFHLNSLNGMVLISKNGKIIYERYQGFRDFSTKQEITIETPIHVASVSKVATSLAILRLVQEQKLNLDTPVKSILKTFPYDEISVRMLLNHRSGLPYYGYFGSDLWNLQTIKSNEDVLNVLSNFKPQLNFSPNTKFTYCNTNYVVLALIIEKITQKKFPIAMEELLFKPLKMNYSFIADEFSDLQSLTPSYNSKKKFQEFTYLDGTYGDKNLYTTARDLMRMDLGSYNPDFISDSLKKQMFTPYSNEKKGKYNYGLGIRMKEDSQKNTYFFHTGWWHGNTSLYCSLRKDTVCIVALSNVYDRRVYQFSKLSPYFGNYPFQLEE